MNLSTTIWKQGLDKSKIFQIFKFATPDTCNCLSHPTHKGCVLLMLRNLFMSMTQSTLTYFVRGSITVWLTSFLTGLDTNKLVNVYLIQRKQSSWIQTSQIGGQLYSDTSSPYELNECLLAWHKATIRSIPLTFF